MDLGLEGRAALVMGASRGIGRGIAAALAREGAKVAIASRDAEALEEAAGAIGDVLALPADTGDLERLAELPAEVEEELGPLEILVTNTGGPPPGGALDNEPDEWLAAYTSLVLAPRVLIGAAVPAMRSRGWGRIVNVGSSSTLEPIPHLNLSNVHRAAAVAFFKTLAGELAGDGITVNTVATGMFATDRLADTRGSLEGAERAAKERVPAGRLGDPAEYGDLVAFLCSEGAAYLTGAVIPLDGGLVRAI
jgi:3-oxoacyl-[acyl-carrier protein] reductase